MRTEEELRLLRDAGRRLSTLRRATGVLTSTLGKACDYSGVTPGSVICEIEHGNASASLKVLARIAAHYSIPVTAVMSLALPPSERSGLDSTSAEMVAAVEDVVAAEDKLRELLRKAKGTHGEESNNEEEKGH